MTNKLILFLLLLGINFSAHAQLSDLHYLPPLKQGWNNDGIRDQAVYLSTPEPTAFVVDVYRGTSATPFASFTISNNAPQIVPLADGDNNITLVTNANTGIVLNNSGLRFISPSGNLFYVNYRGSSAAQSASLTSKGRKAMGTNFKWGGVPNLGGRHRSKSNTLGIMATEDNTTVVLSDYDPDLELRLGNNAAGITADSYTVTLNANESFVFENYIGTVNPPSIAQQQGWIGASIVADKNIVISNGAMNYGRQVNQANRDSGIDQPVPVENIGNEYVFVRGNGMTQNGNRWNEFPLLIATADNTEIYINDNPNNNPAAIPDAVINNGEFYEVDGLRYSSQTPGANMYIYTSENVYAYQCMAGDPNRVFTQGLNFVAPVNCLLPDTMNNIPDITDMAGTVLTGGLTIIAATTTPEANIVVTDGTGVVAKPAPLFLTGSTEWKTYYVPNLTGNVSVQSTGPMAVGFLGTNSARGVAGYFSGFDTVPQVELEIEGDTGCFTGSTIFEATGNFDAYQWFRGNGDDDIPDELIVGANEPSISPVIAGLYYVTGVKGPCEYRSETIVALYCDPDIIVNKSADRSEMMEGETVTFTIEVQNLGIGPVTNLDITDNIPAGLTLVSSNPSVGSFNGSVWNIGTLLGGDTETLEIVVSADEIDTLPLISVVNTVFNTQDQVDNNTTPDDLTAQITIHNDFDNDGIRDSIDLDDDNDGIYDTDECTNLDFSIADGNSYSSDLITVSNYLILDVHSIDNSFNLLINGTDIAGEIQFQRDAGGNLAHFLDGTVYGEDGNPNIWTINGSPGNPIIRVIIDQSGNLQLFGSRGTNGPLELMQLMTPSAPFTWNASGNNTVTIDQDIVGQTNMTGTLLTAACDTDSDGYPDSLDLDKDNDGCTDANEFYRDDTADGGDGGEFGTGVPIVDPIDGSVNAASYIRVVAPIILIENTSEDLAGNDINGQPLSLGQTFNYVLRFQNTGDDDATNYTIRNVLPENVNLLNVDFNGILGASFTEDVSNHTLNISIPDSFVEIGDPQYQITITVELSFNCSDFVNACSSELENHAYSTYQGVMNTRTFSDENNTSSITGCPIPPEFPSNSISGDLASCNEARTVELCTDDVLLTAGSGFSGYTWFQNDVNGNPQPFSDGDPDGNPATLLVDDIGVFTVDKTSGNSCPDLTEIIRVERAGATQTNPIISYFNAVNTDANPDNDLQGEIAECPIDGTMNPKIFLCGATDDALIQLGITDAQSITWQKLDEASCAANDEDCPNRNSGCSWDTIATSNNFAATDSGEYRIQIVYPGGCNSTFYFSIFKNELDVQYVSNDILCTSPGNIRITNPGSGFGYQLVNALNNNIVVPYSANNGPSFDISTNGTYKVQVTQIDPGTNAPIVGACVFETEDIGISERIFSATTSSTAQDCNTLGTITVQALNANPNYSFDLFVDDGSALPIARELATSSNTHTFTNLVAGDYIVVTTTVDGCLESTNVNVAEIPELTLSALTTANISCNPGTVSLSPMGGLPSPDYMMALWSVNGVNLYADEASIPTEDFTNAATFTFGHSNPYGAGQYEFIVSDGSGCFSISNEVDITDIGTISITASDTGINCADTATATLNISASGGLAPYEYSINGIDFQSTSSFTNLAAGIYTITVSDASGSTGTACLESIEHEIAQPYRLTAAAAIIEDSSCNVAGEAVVKILNTTGGTAPYEYSFDGGANFSATSTRNLLPGTYQLMVQDANSCPLPLEITVPSNPATPNFTPDVVYDCDGLGTITVTPSNTSDFNYEYSLNGTLNTPADGNVFTSVADGSHTVDINYSNNLAPNQSTLLYEDFGRGPTTQIAEIGPSYCYEPQDTSTTACNLGPAGVLVTGEYAVTSEVTNPVATRRSPNDRSGYTDGRYLAIDIMATTPPNGVLWQRDNLEVLPNRDITIALWAFNRLRVGSLGNNPQLLFELVDASGSVVGSFVAPQIPKSIDEDHWVPIEVTFNPGTNTNVGIVLRSNLDSNNGNLIALDEISAYQEPETCDSTADITVVVEDNQEFTASLINVIEPNCFGGNDGEIVFEVENFEAATGFQYSVDGGVVWTTSLSSPVTTSLSLSANTYTVDVQRINDTSCTTSFTATLNQPTDIMVGLSLTAEYNCSTGATLEASASGGTPDYTYQLEDTAGTIAVAYQTNPIFTNVTDGDYLVRVRDQNNCSKLSTTALTVDPPQTIAFDVVATACYDGQNNASITATVSAGNSDYQFRITSNSNVSSWQIPNPTTAVSYTFNGLSDGTYTIEVQDGFGCISSAIVSTIAPVLVAQIDPSDVTVCSDGTITVTAQGGDSNFAYAFLPTGTAVQESDFGPSASFTVTSGNEGDYDVYIRDNGGINPSCSYTETVTLNTAPSLTFDAVPTNAECFGETGSIAVSITAGNAPYDYQLIDVDNGTSSQTQNGVLNTTRSYFNLNPGNYTINITDSNGCIQTLSRLISQPNELVGVVTGVTPASCTGDVNDFGFEFSGYPTTVGTIEFSADGGATWIGDNSNPGTSDRLTGFLSGTSVNPSMRTIDGSGNTICQTDLPPFIIPHPLDDLDITLTTILINCNELRVSVQGSEGSAPYEYAHSSDPANFDSLTATWIIGGSIDINGNPVPAGEGMYQWPNLIPGRTYVFYVRDSGGCVRQSNVNVNDITPNPMEITASFEPSCNGASDGEIIYTIVDDDGITEPQMDWTLFDINNNVIQTSGIVPYASTVTINGLPENEYYIVVTQVDASNLPQCISGSENLLLQELDPITADLVHIQDISCEQPGIILIDNINGRGGIYTYTVTGPLPFVTITGSTDNPIEIAANSPAGAYNVVIMDQFGCSANLGDIMLNLAENPTITNIDIDTCPAINTVTIAGSSPAFPNLLYSITGGAPFFDNGGVFDNVSAGSYTAVVKNSAGCEVTQAFTVAPNVQATVNRTADLGCGAGQEAEIQIDITNGSGNYEYEIRDSSNAVIVIRQAVPSTSFTELISTADTYTVTIFDMASNPACERPFTIDVPQAIEPAFTPDLKHVSCFGFTDGAITLLQDSAGGSLTYTMTPNVGSFDTTSNTYNNLPAGNYTIVANDASNGCVSSPPVVVSITQPNEIVFDIPSVTPFTCTTANSENNATISINVSSIVGGSSVYTIFEFEEVSSGFIQTGSASTYTFNDFAGGNVIVRVFDDVGCAAEHTVTVAAFDELQSASIHVDAPINCNAGENISITAISSLSSYATNPGNYEFRQLPSTTYQSSNVFSNLPTGNYTFGIRNIVTNCEITQNHEVRDPDTFDFNVNILSDVICHGGNGSFEIEFTDPTYTGNFSYVIYNTNNTPNNRTDDTVEIPSTIAVIGTTAPLSLAAGNYLIEVEQDGLPLCEKFKLFNIATPAEPISLNIATENVGCSNDQGTALIEVVGGRPLYEITLTNTTTSVTLPIVSDVNTHLFTGLSEGQYTVVVTDDLGCTQTFTNEFELTIPPAITGNVDLIQLECFGDTNGAATYIHNARTATLALVPEYSYVLNEFSDNTYSTIIAQSAPQSTATFSDLSVGFYQIVVSDVYNCSDELSFEIIEPNETVAQLNKITEFTCEVNAELELIASGGVAPYEWSVDGNSFNPMNEMNGANTHVFQNISDGTYSYYVRDSFDCVSIVSNPVVINPIEMLTLAIDDSAAVINCFNESTAVILADADGGLGDYQYALFADSTFNTELVPYQSSGTFIDLAAGTYYVRVQSGVDCFDSKEVVIAPANEIIINPIPTPVLCFGDELGSILIEATGGSGEFQYAIAPNLNQFDDNNFFDELAAGFYDIIVRDKNNGCPQLLTIEIESPDEKLDWVSLTPTAEVCAGDADGTLTIDLIGGTPPYSTALNSDDDADFVEGRLFIDNLAPGDYFIFVRDANGCPLEELIRIGAGANLNSTHEVIYECTGGTPTGSIEFTFEDETILSDDVTFTLDGDTNSTQLGNNFTNIPPGDHTMLLVYNGCEKTIDFNVEDFEPIIAVSTPTSIECFGTNEGVISINASGGSGEFQYAISPDLNQFVDTAIFNELLAGTYDIIVEDKNTGCRINEQVEITQPTEALDWVSLTSEAEICAGEADGSITMNLIGGTPPYSTALNSEDPADFVEGRLFFDNLEAGDYTVYVRDANGCPLERLINVEVGVNLNNTHQVIVECSSDTPTSRIEFTFEDETLLSDDVIFTLDGDSSTMQLGNNFENIAPGNHSMQLEYNGCIKTVNFTIDAFEPLQVNAEQLGLNEITATAIGGKEAYTYYFDDENNGNDNVFYITRTDTYTVRVVDENGCEAITTIDMEFIDIEIPNFFTPDGDGLNDTWGPNNVSQFPDIYIKIYDRYGREVYRITDPEVGWDGFYNQTELPTGDYWYVIKLNGETDEREFIGNFTLYR